MPNYTQTRQGNFVATGDAIRLDFRNGVDWIHIYNLTTLAAGGAGTGVEFRWMRGFPNAACIEYQKLAANDEMVPVYNAAGGFTVFDDGADVLLGAEIAIQAIDNGIPPVVDCGATAGLFDNDTVRIINTPGVEQFGGVDFTMDTLNANVDFELPFAPQIVATGAVVGAVRRVNRETMYYPRRRYIAAIDQAAQATIILTVIHDYNVGEFVRMQVPDAFDMTEINGRLVEIIAVDDATNTIQIDLNTTAFTAFAWPLTADVPFTPAQVIPVGEDEGDSTAATENESRIGILLAAGVDSPAGIVNDEIYWIAGKSFDVDV